MGPMIDALERSGVSPASVLPQSFALADCRLTRSRGWDVIWLGSTDVARAVAEGIGWIGPEAGHVTSTVCTPAHAAGIDVACYTVNRRHQRDAVIADGVDAVFSDDPLYIVGDAGRRASDLFARQVWLPGMLPDTSRGRFYPDDSSWGFDVSDTVTSTLTGFLAPPDPEAFTLYLDVRVHQTCADSRRCCGSVFLSTDDHPYRPSSGSSPGANGYHFLLRGDGTLDVHRVIEGVATTLASSTGGNGAAAGRLRPAADHRHGLGTLLHAHGHPHRNLTVADATYRPVPVVHLGSAFAGVRFKNVVFA